jgi:hypothetical protein
VSASMSQAEAMAAELRAEVYECTICFDVSYCTVVCPYLATIRSRM